MKTFDSRYSKMLLILLGVLVAIVIGFHSNAVGFGSELQLSDPNLNAPEQSAPLLTSSGKMHLKLLSFLK